MLRRTQTWGIVVMRCQGPEMKRGWRRLIEHARLLHDRVLIVIGLPAGKWPTPKNPLSFLMVKEMIRQAFPSCRNLVFTSLQDSIVSHESWSEDFDALIEKICGGASFKAYYSRDGFEKDYFGKHKGTYKMEYVKPIEDVSGTEMRKGIEFPHTRDGRAAAIWLEHHRIARDYSAADIAITDDTVGHERVVIVSRPELKGLWLFPGGLVEPTDDTDEDAARRERNEEVKGVETGHYYKLGERFKVRDPRYEDTPDGIKTSFFQTRWISGDPQPGDDVKFVRWATRLELPTLIAPWHQPHVQRLETCWAKIERECWIAAKS
ncbi:MAG: NUDIX domain-containing protein [bacterium]|nr:NUDIX domain-containing protein [bacterium]